MISDYGMFGSQDIDGHFEKWPPDKKQGFKIFLQKDFTTFMFRNLILRIYF